MNCKTQGNNTKHKQHNTRNPNQARKGGRTRGKHSGTQWKNKPRSRTSKHTQERQRKEHTSKKEQGKQINQIIPPSVVQRVSRGRKACGDRTTPQTVTHNYKPMSTRNTKTTHNTKNQTRRKTRNNIKQKETTGKGTQTEEQEAKKQRW